MISNQSKFHRINWKYFLCSLIFTVLISFIFVKFPTNFEEFENRFCLCLQFLTIPSLFITCIVIYDIREVKEDIRADDGAKITYYSSEECDKQYFFKKYDDGKFILFMDLTKIIYRKKYISDDFLNASLPKARYLNLVNDLGEKRYEI